MGPDERDILRLRPGTPEALTAGRIDPAGAQGLRGLGQHAFTNAKMCCKNPGHLRA